MLWIVLDEAVLQRLIGMPSVVWEQLHRMAQAAGLPNVTLQVLPFRKGAHSGMIGRFNILSFPDPVDPDVVHLESPTGADLYLDDTDQVHRYKALFERLQAVALTPDDSSTLLARLAEKL